MSAEIKYYNHKSDNMLMQTILLYSARGILEVSLKFAQPLIARQISEIYHVI